jgi:hypothetical protein
VQVEGGEQATFMLFRARDAKNIPKVLPVSMVRDEALFDRIPIDPGHHPRNETLYDIALPAGIKRHFDGLPVDQRYVSYYSERTRMLAA